MQINFSEIHSWEQKNNIIKLADLILSGDAVPVRIAYGVLIELAKYGHPTFIRLHDALEKIHRNEKAKLYRQTVFQEYKKITDILSAAPRILIENERQLLQKNTIQVISAGSGSRGVILVFTTLFNNFYITKLSLAAILIAAGYSVILVNDSSGFYYLNGISNKLCTWDLLLAEIKYQLTAFKGQNMFITGFSSGSYAALMAALELKPEYFVVFSATVDLSFSNNTSYPKFFCDPDGTKTPKCLRRDLSKELLETDLRGKFIVGGMSQVDISEFDKVCERKKISKHIIENEGHICVRHFILKESFSDIFSDYVSHPER
jgi:hypothetical protein